MKWLAPSLPTGGLVGLELGVAESTNNAFGLNFGYVGSGSTSNNVAFGFYGSNTLTLYPNAVKIGNGSIALYLCSGGTFDGLFASASAKCTGGSGTATMLTLQ
jgi:hypothetical protein